MDAIIPRPPAGISTQRACVALGVSRASLHRRRALIARPAAPDLAAATPRRRSPPRTLTAAERQIVVERLRQPRFVDLAPAEVYATLLDEGIYHCSIRTMYRILDAHHEVRERRNQARHPVYTNRNCWLKQPIPSGRGTSPNCGDPRNGAIFISTSSSTSSAAGSSDGASPTLKVPPCSRNFSTTPSANTRCRRAN